MKQRGFSAIELIGAVAIIVILTALLLPKIIHRTTAPDVVQTLSGAHVTETAVAIQSIQAAVVAHLAQFGSLASEKGAALSFGRSYDRFDQVLLAEGLIERPFSLPLGTNSVLRLLRVSGLSPFSAVDGSNGAYDLDGEGRNSVVGAPFLVEAVLPGITVAEARALNDSLDSPRLGENTAGEDFRGRVVYPKAGPDGRAELHIYITRGR